MMRLSPVVTVFPEVKTPPLKPTDTLMKCPDLDSLSAEMKTLHACSDSPTHRRLRIALVEGGLGFIQVTAGPALHVNLFFVGSGVLGLLYLHINASKYELTPFAFIGDKSNEQIRRPPPLTWPWVVGG